MDLSKLFNPSSVAIIGASNTPGKVGFDVLKNLIDADFSGDIYPINIKEQEVQGLKAYSSVLNVQKNIDVAIVVVPAQFVPKVIQECAKKNIKNAIIITAGFSETGEEGKKLEEQVKKIVEENKMNVIGPNTLGVINTENGLNASFSANFPRQGSIALVSQSGALCTAILDWARQERIGFSKFISTGNKSFMSECDYFSYLENDPRTKSVFVYMESVKNSKEFLHAATRLAKKKPIVLIKAGRSPAGAKAASSHTGAMAVDDDIFTVACKKSNILRVNSIEGFFDMAKLLSKLTKVKGFRLAVVTNAGGPGVIVADSASKHCFPLPDFSLKTLEAVKTINPHARNPLDLIGDAKPIDYKTAIRMLQHDNNVDIIYALLTPQSMTDPERVADVVVELNKHKPIICSFIGGTALSHPRKYLSEHGIVEYETPERGIKALSRFQEYFDGKKKRRLTEQKSFAYPPTRKMMKGKSVLSLEESFSLLDEFGLTIPKTIFFSKIDELDFNKMKFPVVLKSAVGLPHKTDRGLIKINIQSKEELEKDYEKMVSKLLELKYKPRLVIQESIVGQEVLVSFITTEFGKVITFGLGGIFVEVMKDFSQKITPLTDEDIDEMLAEVKGTKILLGARTKKKYDVGGLKQLIKTVAKIAVTYPEIKEFELNPVMVTENNCFAVDAVVSIDEKK